MPKTTDTNEPLKRAELGKRVERLTTTGVFETRDAAPQETEDGQRIYWTLAYAEGVEDRHNTIIDHRAFANVTVDDFRILTHHDQTSDPVGKPVALDYDERGLWVGTVYAPTARGQEVETLVRDGYFRAVSVGFIPVDGYKRKADGVTVFTRCELLELSLVNCPSSKGALFDLARNFDADPAALEEIYADVLRAVTPEEEAAFLRPFLAQAEAGGMLNAVEVKIAFEALVGRPVAKSTIYRMLERQDWRKIAPRPRHPKADPAAQAAFKKTRTGTP